MSRTKPNIPLLTEDQVDEQLQAEALTQDKLDVIRASADERVSAIKAQRKADETPLLEVLKQVKNKILYYLNYHRVDFSEIRTRNLRFGQIGWRKTREDKLIIVNSDVALAALKRLGLTDCIRLKEEVNKHVFAAKGVEVITQVDGVKFPEEAEEPWYEARREPPAPERP